MSVDGVRLLGSQYRLSAQIGRGGMGEVWRGVDAQGRPRAFKLLLPHYAQDAEVVRRFLAERQVLTSVRDPNVVGVHDLVIEGSTLGIVMDLVEGQDLRHYLRERGTLPSGVACRIGAQVASGLAAIHAVRIVHRDVKPENILLDLRADPPQARLTDFGVAKVLEETSVPTPTAVAGTPCYMAPEVINGQIPSTRSDLYSLGIVLYEMLCGVAPFVGLANGPMMQAHLTMDPGRPGGIDDRVWSLISQLVSKVAGQRPPDAGLVAAQLWSLAELTGGVPALPKLASPPPPVRAVTPAVVVAETQLAPPTAPPPPPPGIQGWTPNQSIHPGVSTLPTIQGQPGAGWVTNNPAGSGFATGGSYLTPGFQFTPGMQMTPMPVAYVAVPGKNRTPIAVGVIVGLLILLAGMVSYLVLGGYLPSNDDKSNAAGPVAATPVSSADSPPASTPSSAAPTSSTPSASSSADKEAAALAELNRRIASDGARVPLNGQWVAMLGGKWVGITDPLQTTSSGSHTFMAADILAEHEAIRSRVSGVEIVLLDSRTFGNRISHDGAPLYVTIGLGAFGDRDSVLAWCAAQFPEYSGKDLENRCTPSRLAT